MKSEDTQNVVWLLKNIKMKKEKQKNLYSASIFLLPDSREEMLICVLLFFIMSLLIYYFESLWTQRFAFKTVEERRLQRVLIWEFGTVLSIVTVFFLKQYIVILPLLFFLAFLIIWYLFLVIKRRF